MAKIELKGLNNAWLSPRGVLAVDFKCKHGCPRDAFHHCIAIHILAALQNVSCRGFWNKSGDPTSQLEALGWVRLCTFVPGTKPRWILHLKQRQTKRQTEIIASWLVENDLSAETAVDYI